MEERPRCARCHSFDLFARGGEYRCWRCGAPVSVAAVSRPVPELPAQEVAAPRMPPPRVEAKAPEGSTFLVQPTLSREAAQATAEAALRGVLRPRDMQVAQVAPLSLVYVPLWRVDVGVEVFHVGIQPSPGPQLRWVLPTGGFRHRDDVVILPGRRFYPIDPTKTQNPLVKVRLPIHELVPLDAPRAEEGAHWVEADVSAEEAAQDAAERVRRLIQPQGALYASFNVRVRSAALCHYPLWVLQYRYSGEAARGNVEECHVAVSARSGKVVSDRHPSVFWSMLGKARGLFSTTGAP